MGIRSLLCMGVRNKSYKVRVKAFDKVDPTASEEMLEPASDRPLLQATSGRALVELGSSKGELEPTKDAYHLDAACIFPQTYESPLLLVNQSTSPWMPTMQSCPTHFYIDVPHAEESMYDEGERHVSIDPTF